MAASSSAPPTHLEMEGQEQPLGPAIEFVMSRQQQHKNEMQSISEDNDRKKFILPALVKECSLVQNRLPSLIKDAYFSDDNRFLAYLQNRDKKIQRAIGTPNEARVIGDVKSALTDELKFFRETLPYHIRNELHTMNTSFNMSQDIMKLLYFASILGEKREREICLAHFQREGTNLSETDLMMIASLGDRLILRPQDPTSSHKDALSLCFEHAKNWLGSSHQILEEKCGVTYSELKEKLRKLMNSGYFVTPLADLIAPREDFYLTENKYKEENLYAGTILHCGLTLDVTAIPFKVPTMAAESILSFYRQYQHPSIVQCFGFVGSKKDMVAVERITPIKDYFIQLYDEYRASSAYNPGTKTWWAHIKVETIAVFRQVIDVVTQYYWNKIPISDFVPGLFVSVPKMDGMTHIKFIPAVSIEVAKEYSKGQINHLMVVNMKGIVRMFFDILALDGVVMKKCRPGNMNTTMDHLYDELKDTDENLKMFIENFRKRSLIISSKKAMIWFLNSPLFWRGSAAYDVITRLAQLLRESEFESDLAIVMDSFPKTSWKTDLQKWKKKTDDGSDIVMNICYEISIFHGYNRSYDVINFLNAVAHHVNDKKNPEYPTRPVLVHKLTDPQIVMVWNYMDKSIIPLIHKHLIDYFARKRVITKGEVKNRILGFLVGKRGKEIQDDRAEELAASFDVKHAK